ncbi:histidine kinase [Spongiactinospora sp. TRM90649]|uniref:sensor histidine kinase n=1 Tax=Spongiactinospora sp. TRM90649 TaxID=3031114 RepID=UPI0023F9E1A0|nr:histidine kinase [Spongiactinospora sp. TRM90649]MDF5757975.1 histidine kinase [Spongiactinospora sp. TRM90649]
MPPDTLHMPRAIRRALPESVPARRRGRVTLADAAVAAVVTCATAVPALATGPPPWWAALLLLASSAPILLRRAAPLPVGLVLGGATAVLALAWHDLQGAAPMPVPAGALVWTCAFAATAVPPVTRAVGIAAQGAGVVAALTLHGHDTHLLTAYAAAYAVGAATRARRAQRATERERAGRLAGERAAAVAVERARIARDVHDIVARSVGLMVVQAEAGPLVVRDDPERAEAVFETISATGREAAGQLRAAVPRGHTPREPPPGIDALPALIDRAGRAGLSAVLVERGERRGLPTATGVAVYRIVQESLTSTLRHAAEPSARVSLEWTDAALIVRTADDGGGVRALREGHGIIGMRERAGACGGTLTVDPPGLTVTATLPIG